MEKKTAELLTLAMSAEWTARAAETVKMSKWGGAGALKTARGGEGSKGEG